MSFMESLFLVTMFHFPIKVYEHTFFCYTKDTLFVLKEVILIFYFFFFPCCVDNIAAVTGRNFFEPFGGCSVVMTIICQVT